MTVDSQGGSAKLRLTRPGAVRCAVLFAVVMGFGLGGLMMAPTARAQDLSSSSSSSVLFVVDTSGSMSGTPLEQAKDALRAGVDALDPDQAAGLRAYGGSCSDGGDLLVPITTGNHAELGAATDQLSAGGGTPTPEALRAAAGDLPASGERTVILVSDGQSSCGDPCPVARNLEEDLGIGFKVHTVGFNAPEQAENELTCIAEATGGQYFVASNTEELSDAISTAAASDDDTPFVIDCLEVANRGKDIEDAARRAARSGELTDVFDVAKALEGGLESLENTVHDCGEGALTAVKNTAGAGQVAVEEGLPTAVCAGAHEVMRRVSDSYELPPNLLLSCATYSWSDASEYWQQQVAGWLDFG